MSEMRRSRIARGLLPITLLIAAFCAPVARVKSAERLPVPGIPYAPRNYVCCRASQAPTIDGRLDDRSWQQAKWTELFGDIQGSLMPLPRFETRVKMLWDSGHLYVAADLQEPNIWAKLIKRDTIIYHDNDFEVFIDPDMDTHEYYELELNAFNTVWDLLLLKPYRDGGPAVNAWDIQGLRTAVSINGTLNRPGDVDSGWSVEIAIPWSVLAECAHRPSPPRDGDQWRINFSRVEWRTEVTNGEYVKLVDPVTGKWLAEDNWVWSPQGLIAMHYPEMWGIVQFSTAESGSGQVPVAPDRAEPARWALRQLYYAQCDYHTAQGHYTSNVADLQLDDVSVPDFVWPPTIEATTHSYSAGLSSRDGKHRLTIREDGRLVQTER